MKYRHELKYIISRNEALILRNRLKLIMNLDQNSRNGSYTIRSLYFDDPFSSSYYEKMDGVLYRKKYRIRFYNNDYNFIRLECKHKHNNMTSKEQARITKEVCLALLNKQIIKTNNEFVNRFLMDMKNKNLIPSVIVEYERIAFTYPLSDVRVTFDFNIKSGKYDCDLFGNQPLYSVMDNVVLEVKFNDFLPEHIAIVLGTIPSFRQAVSKFALCRQIK